MIARYALLSLAIAAAEDETPAEEPKSTGPFIPSTAAYEGATFYEPFLSTWESTWKVSRTPTLTAAGSSSRIRPAATTRASSSATRRVSTPSRPSSARPFDPKGKGLVIQYELQLKNGLQCGGAYLKLLSASDALDANGFKAETPYTIMFGPDKCGETNKVHFILRHQNPVSKEWEEKHLVSPPQPDTMDKQTHLYTAIVGTDNTVKILVDNVEKKSASLLSETDFAPPVNPSKMIDDPTDSKPADWIDDPKMDEPGRSSRTTGTRTRRARLPTRPRASRRRGWMMRRTWCRTRRRRRRRIGTRRRTARGRRP